MSPGPSSLTILATALSQGRRNALALSSGVVISDILWAIVVAAGLLAAVRHSQTLFSALKILIGCYLTFMACKSVYSGIKNKSVFERNDRQPLSLPRHFLKGSAITLANPQIAITWLTAFSISMNVDAGLTFFGIVIPICAAISVLIYVGYAMVFSTPTMFKAYSTMHRPFDLMLGALFAFAAIKLLSSLNHG